MITFSRFGNYGNLGNQLFQYASMLGLSDTFGHKVVLPSWNVSDYFSVKPTIQTIKALDIQERHYHYDLTQFEQLAHLSGNITGWLQSEKYWINSVDKVRECLKFVPQKQSAIVAKYAKLFTKETIAISIRRGDYVDNPNYELLNADYYYLALLEEFKNWKDCNILIFSDDIPYCKIHFECMPNVTFIEGLSPIEQLMLGSNCTNFIIANSTFSWWMAYLGEVNNGKIVRPNYLFAGDLLKNSDSKDFYPDRWVTFDHKGKTLDLLDTAFVIPFSIDSIDRKENIIAVTQNIRRYFKTNITVMQHGDGEKLCSLLASYYRFDEPKFHRTKMINQMVLRVSSYCKFAINYDADILIPPLQLYLSIERLRGKECEFIYPYDGRFARVQRTHLPTIQKYNDVGQLRGNNYKGMGDGLPSVGGIVAFNIAAFFQVGAENEDFISYAPEDMERFYRYYNSAYEVQRSKGAVYHIDHAITTNSSTSHADYANNEKVCESATGMSIAQLWDYIQAKSPTLIK